MTTQEERLIVLEQEVSQLVAERHALDQRIIALHQQIEDQRRQLSQQEQETSQMSDALLEVERKLIMRFDRQDAQFAGAMTTLEANLAAMETRLRTNAAERSEQMLTAFQQLLEIVDSRLPPVPR